VDLDFLKLYFLFRGVELGCPHHYLTTHMKKNAHQTQENFNITQEEKWEKRRIWTIHTGN